MCHVNTAPNQILPPQRWVEEAKPEPYYSLNHDKMHTIRAICTLIMCTLSCSLYLTVYYLLDTSQPISLAMFVIKFPILSMISLYISMRSTSGYSLVKKKYI